LARHNRQHANAVSFRHSSQVQSSSALGDHEMRETLEARKDLPPAKIPLWDAVLVLPPGVKWVERSPGPVWWTKQTGYSGEEKPDKITAVFWKNSTRQLPVLSDWYLEAREAWRVAREANRACPRKAGGDLCHALCRPTLSKMARNRTVRQSVR
jgi:hypothetical protein